jgi:hypothetical protein
LQGSLIKSRVERSRPAIETTVDELAAESKEYPEASASFLALRGDKITRGHQLRAT